jgi:flagellar biosynthetic protein FlhB
MADTPDKESQTEEATEKKVRDAIEQGNVPISREVSIFAAVAGMLIIAAFLLKDGVRSVVMVLEHLLDNAGEWSFQNGVDATNLLHIVILEAARFLAPILIVLIVGGLAASFIQNPPSLVFSRLQPDFSRISPATGFGRLVSKRGGIEFLKSVFKFTAVSIVVLFLLQSERGTFLNSMFLDPSSIPEVILSIAMRLLSAVGIATVLLVTADLVWARIHWRKELRMSRQEVKDEMKQMQGDPLMKSRLRSLALDRARKSMISAVPRATLVVANPTHYAIALRYVREEGGAPMVLAKGQDLIALKIREIAEEHQIPVIEDKALARSMYDSVEVDRTIPPEFYRAVAELIHFLHNRGGRRAAK